MRPKEMKRLKSDVEKVTELFRLHVPINDD